MKRLVRGFALVRKEGSRGTRASLIMGMLGLLVITLGITTAGVAQAQSNTKVFSRAKDAYERKQYAQAARLCWRYLKMSQPAAEKYEAAQFFLASALEELGFYHAAVEYYFQVANNRRAPELLARAIRALERLALSRPIDEALVLRDLIGDTDLGALPDDLADFVNYWQAMSNLHRGLDEWASERFAKISRQGYYFFASLYATSIRQLQATSSQRAKRAAVRSFAELFGALDLGAALEALRRRGEGDSKLAYALKALITEDGTISVQPDKLPKGYEIELALLGLARVAAETGVLIERARETDEEQLGKPFAYNVTVGGLPIYRRAPRFESRAPAIRSVAARLQPVRKIQGQAMQGLARLLFEQKRFAAAYDTLGQIPRGTVLGSEVLLERAWSKFKAGDAHRAMGLLYALDAPVYRTLFAPEKYVLRGLIYRRFCHFRAAKSAARRFRQQYEVTLRRLREGAELTSLSTVKKAALRRGQAAKLSLFMRTLGSERDRANKFRDEWKKGGLLAHLQTVYTRKRDQIRTELKVALAASSAEVGEEMLQTEEQVNLLEYEVGQAIFQRVSETIGVARAQKRAPKVPVSSDRVYYKFQGEYWTDELPYYKFNIEDRCVE